MLPPQHRLRTPHDFVTTLRGGRRSGSRELVVHVRIAEFESSVRAGLIVGRGVGNSVTRNRVKRRLRALMASRIERMSGGTDVVLRALPASAGATSADLAVSLDRCLERCGAGVVR